MPNFQVYVDNNFHYMDEDERYPAGEFDTLEEALAKCRNIVDEALNHLYEPGMTAEALFEAYASFGDDPWVQGAKFSARDYARQRCVQICMTAAH